MIHVNHFSYGPLTPALAYTMSCTGAFLGLRSTARARASTGSSRISWLLLGAVSIGATGIWVMHFIAMLGFTVPGVTILYSLPLTLLSAFVAVVVVGIGLFLVGAGMHGRLLLGGFVTGCGVAIMHYTGMAAVQMTDNVEYDPLLVAASLLIAVVAATAALWATLRIRGLWATVGASLIMGVAVSGMHYTGMAAMRVEPGPRGAGPVTGLSAASFLLPLILGISVVTVLLVLAIALSPTEAELRADAALSERIARIERDQSSRARPVPAAARRPLPRPGAWLSPAEAPGREGSAPPDATASAVPPGHGRSVRPDGLASAVPPGHGRAVRPDGLASAVPPGHGRAAGARARSAAGRSGFGCAAGARARSAAGRSGLGCAAGARARSAAGR